MTDLPPFNENAACLKCRGTDISARYIGKPTDHLWRPQCGQASWSAPEHIDRSCRRCGYEWAEATADVLAPAGRQAGGAWRDERAERC